MGGVFVRGLLKAGHAVIPVTRELDMAAVATEHPEPEAVLVAVAEKDLHPVLQAIPRTWKNRLALIQNELLPRDWRQYGIANPTIISVWFEKKPGQDFKVLIPSPVHGPHATLIKEALECLGINVRLIANEETLLFELLRKNVYILTTNITGLETGGTVGAMWAEHEKLARKVASDVMDIQAWLTGTEPDREALIAGMVEAIDSDPDHGCTGRSAPARLERALAQADEAGLAVHKLREIYSQA